MQTRKLYYEDSHTHTFTATVTECDPTTGGYRVTLDATAFYPEGGGQACDIGTLGGVPVLSVTEDNGQVLHLCAEPLEVGATITGSIDWERRFDLMQQHSGEHMVSGVIHRRYGYHNVGFHMGADMVTVDFDGPIPEEDLPAIEAEVNAAIWRNLPVRCWYPTEEELPGIPYRTKKQLPWPVRIVEFPDIDLCACCGTQVQHTGEIGLVKLFSCVKFHQGVRIEMACGKRAFDILSQVYRQNKEVSQAFSAKILETGQAAKRMNQALAAEKFRTTGLEKRVFSQIAQAYGDRDFVLHFEEGLSGASLRELADSISQTCGTAVVLSGTDDSGYNLCIVSRKAEAKNLGQSAVTALKGRGGGKPEAFQGSLRANRREIEAFFLPQSTVDF